MIKFIGTILQFAKQGEKTGWTYIPVPASIAEQLKPGIKKSFRVKGKIDDYAFKGIALLPMGGGEFIMALNATIRKGIGKRRGARVNVHLQADDNFTIDPPAELLECLQDEPTAVAFFQKLTKGHQAYFIKWIASAKTDQTKTKRIAQMVTALSKGQGFGEMLRNLKQDRSRKFG